MIEHIFLPGIDLKSANLLDEHKEWLKTWLSSVERESDAGDIASSLCIQGAISEIALYRSIKTDWIGIMDEYLTDENSQPLAYSERYGKRLHKFNQWKQNTIHAIHGRWWMERILNSDFDDKPIVSSIEQFIQSSGWIYNSMVSPTRLLGRMRAELMMSLAMGTEILLSARVLHKHKEVFHTLLSSTPRTNFLSAEYFRIKSLEHLDLTNIIPSQIEEVLSICEAGKGYCDFSVATKVDDYMGSRKRVGRDVALHSPVSSLHAYKISTYCGDAIKDHVGERIVSFGYYLKSNPFDIPHFRMRDIDIPFGTDLTPLEIIGASYITDAGTSHK